MPRTCRIPARISPSSPRAQPNMDIDAAAADKFPKPRLSPCVLAADPLCLTRQPGIFHELHAPIPLFPADSARNAKRGRDCLASTDAAHRHDATGGGGHLRLSAPWLPRVAENLPDRAGGTEPVGRDRAVNACRSVGGPLARERTLRRVWQGNAAHKGSA